MEFLIVLMIPVLAVGMGWLFGRNTALPLVEPEMYTMENKED